VLVRATLERMLSPTRLDQVFHEHASQQYERELLFSSLVDVMARVVARLEPSVLAAYRTLREKLGVSDEAVYQKLRLVERAVSEALVRDSFASAREVIERLTTREFVTLLQRWVAKMDLSRYRKIPRGPKKPQTKRTPRSKGGRVSTAVMLGTYKPPP
jgi:ribosomal protein L16 Arg81 hydroxylase